MLPRKEILVSGREKSCSYLIKFHYYFLFITEANRGDWLAFSFLVSQAYSSGIVVLILETPFDPRVELCDHYFYLLKLWGEWLGSQTGWDTGGLRRAHDVLSSICAGFWVDTGSEEIWAHRQVKRCGLTELWLARLEGGWAHSPGDVRTPRMANLSLNWGLCLSFSLHDHTLSSPLEKRICHFVGQTIVQHQQFQMVQTNTCQALC